MYNHDGHIGSITYTFPATFYINNYPPKIPHFTLPHPPSAPSRMVTPHKVKFSPQTTMKMGFHGFLCRVGYFMGIFNMVGFLT